ncbi:glycosyltransferase [Winogradskyella sediminis]|uniref:Glycosyltransferase involved in cell wall bisynthesis n=1 Tax=Winogradskyella sediminis TaxID=1382466 RepID=A0A1H1LQM2_9FLAO|nr:glycosyltransferase [Winogradskyella sediminis]SDR76841.1 Glycosyltransferase involved in cell wall bisynthesis [Winogradskyella sediminis]
MKSDKINITFALPNLLPGGAERVMSYIAQNIDSRKFKSTLLIVGYSKDASYDIKNIDVVFLEKPRVSKGVVALFKYIQNHKPDILVSAIGHLNTVTAYFSLIFPKTIFIAREVNVLSVLANYENQGKSSPFDFISEKRFNFFNKVICQSQDMLDDFHKNFNIKKNKLVVINNPITDNFKVKNQKSKNEPIRFITVARFDLEKGHHRILEALSQVNFDFHYTLIGKGVLYDDIFKLIDLYNLKEKISHIPFTKEVEKYLAESDLYLQASYTEGFPNSIIESCMVGTPVLAIDAPGGINEIIYPDVNGKIVSNVGEFVSELENINSNFIFNAKAVSATVSDRYSRETILSKYEDLFTNVYDQRYSKK